jgi:hypothetical protein
MFHYRAIKLKLFLLLLINKSMSEISLQKLNDLFVDTLQRATVKLLAQEDEEIEYELFEEFDAGIHSFLHENSLQKLEEAGFIDKEIKILSLELREKAIRLLENKREVEKIRFDTDWRQVLELSDKIRNLKINFDKSCNKI